MNSDDCAVEYPSNLVFTHLETHLFATQGSKGGSSLGPGSPMSLIRSVSARKGGPPNPNIAIAAPECLS